MVAQPLPASRIPDALAPSFDRFRHRAERIHGELSRGLDGVYSAHQLTYTELMATQRELRRLDTESRAPAPQAFWDTSAHPRAQILVTAATAVIDRGADELQDALGRLRQSVDLLEASAPAQTATTPGLTRHVVDDAADRIASAMPSREPLDRVGERWHRRLRRSAWLQTVPGRVWAPSTDLDDQIDRAELVVLETLPWAHGDRMLSAFELAHVDIRNHLRRRLTLATGDPAEALLAAIRL